MQKIAHQPAGQKPDTPPIDQRSFGQRALIAAGISLVLIALFLLFRAIVDVLLLVFAAILLAILLYALAEPLARYSPLSPRWSVLSVAVLLLGGLGFIGWLLVPDLARQLDELVATIPESLSNLHGWVSQYDWGSWLMSQIQNPARLPPTTALISNVRGIFSTTGGILIGVLIFFFLGIYLALEPHLYHRGIIRLLPLHRRERGEEVLDNLHQTLRWWLLSKLLAMIVIGVLTTVGLMLLGVPLAFTLGFIAALLSFIPNLGPTLALIPAVLVGLSGGWVQALQVLILYLAIQALESYLITPYIERRTISMPPALMLSAQVALGVLVGGIGVFLAAPLVAVSIVLVRMLFVEDVLGDSGN
jgi:predicted PurR-regulated permease PerM